jgi:hypothetical protein
MNAGRGQPPVLPSAAPLMTMAPQLIDHDQQDDAASIKPTLRPRAVTNAWVGLRRLEYATQTFVMTSERIRRSRPAMSRG